MEKETFSVIIVPHDIKKTRTYRIPYRVFYTVTIFIAVGVVAMVVFLSTYGRLLVKTRETLMLERQVQELTMRNEKIGEVMRNLAEMHAMDLKVRGMLGLDIAREDSLALNTTFPAANTGEEEIETEKTQMLRAIPSFWPVRGFITKGYNLGRGEGDPAYHPGIDIGVERGVPVRAAASGVVIEVRWDDVYGYVVRIDHGYGIKTLYGHNDRLVVIKGERVGRGQTIAHAGSTGRSSAPHLHFEVTQDNVHVDPLKYLLK
ncbi:MAG: M23 family metallopeptidase [Candidatus Krumholzibacteria bacterium]|nr:M23 family metallopeptidase [Candidatus Krumholzibacteria bacterium]